MHVLWVTLKIKPECREQYLAAATKHAETTLREESEYVLRFDVLEDTKEPNTFYYYEIYTHREAMDLHNKTPHRLEYGEIVKDCLAEPLTAAVCTDVRLTAAD